MSKRHYRQMVMMIVHFLALIPEKAYTTVRSVYKQDLDSSKPQFENITETLYVFRFIPTPSTVSFFLLRVPSVLHFSFSFSFLSVAI